MQPYVEDSDFQLHVGDALQVLRELPDESVDCVVTSPPYWGLRDYGTGEWEGGDEDCDHKAGSDYGEKSDTNKGAIRGGPFREACRKCGAQRVDQQLGLEPTPDQYVTRMVEVFREVRRVLAGHGTCWVNLGDSYAAARAGHTGGEQTMAPHARGEAAYGPPRKGVPGPRDALRIGLKHKDLVGIPWRVAFALQADGWTLRSDIVWGKPNPMPESVTDRPTKAHEMVFLLAKSPWIGRERGELEARLSAEDARWAALLVDAEGNICVKRVKPTEGKSPQFGAQIAVGSTSRELLERLAGIVGAGNVNERPGTNAPMFYWQISNKVAQDLLYAIYPHLIVKRRQARIAIHLENLLYHRGKAQRRSDKENAALESLWLRNKECNQFGEPDLADVPEPTYGRWGVARYWFDQEAVREKAEWARWGDQTNGKHQSGGGTASWIPDRSKGELQGGRQRRRYDDNEFKTTDERNTRYQGPSPADGGRNIRSVWEIATQPYPEAHFATFPEELARRCILAGCPLRVCRVCGKPSERIVERERGDQEAAQRPKHLQSSKSGLSLSGNGSKEWAERGATAKTLGWSDCGCSLSERADLPLEEGVTRQVVDLGGVASTSSGPRSESKWRPGVVLDPFLGSGTTALVARNHGRHAIGIELSQEYAELAAKRTRQLSLLA